MAIRVRAREFETYEEAEAHAAETGGSALTMPGGRFLAISARDCQRIDRAGGPETARFIGRPPRWVARGDRLRGGIRFIAVGR